jgi:ketosteroid isomerase-like protein
MAEHPNIGRIRDAYAAFSKGDLDTVGAMYTDDVVWHVGGHSPLAGDYKGQEEIFGFFGRLFELSEGTLQLEVHDVLANDEHGTALVHMTAKRGDRMLSQNAVHVFHIQDGKTKEFWAFEEDQAADDAFWS